MGKSVVRARKTSVLLLQAVLGSSAAGRGTHVRLHPRSEAEATAAAEDDIVRPAA